MVTRITLLRVLGVLPIAVAAATVAAAAEPSPVVGTWRGTAEEISSPHIQAALRSPST